MRVAWLACVIVAAACDAPSGANPDVRCHPLAVGDCLLPWPSSYYLKMDASTPTGLRVALPDGVLPANQDGLAMSAARLNLLDGFSPAGMLVANLKARVDPSGLPPLTDFTVSLAAAAKVQLVEYDSGARVPLFAEPDHNAADDEDQVLLIHPMVRLKEKTRYVVALQKIVDDKGRAVHNAPFDALKGGNHDGRLGAIGAAYDQIFAKLRATGVNQNDLTLAWDFTTGSDQQITQHLVKMRDRAFTEWGAQNLGYQITATTEPTDDHLFRELAGTFQAPSFLASEDAAANIMLDGDAQPVYRAPQSFPLLIHIPNCAKTATKPLPMMIFGHGLFGSAMGEMNSGYEKQVTDQLCMVQIGTDWIGLSDNDISTVASNVVPDFSHFDLVTDRLQQAQVNFMILAHLAVAKLKDDPGLVVNGKPVSDGSEIYYYGISQGGIEGGTFMALSPDVERGVLNVPGGEYSFLLGRSVDFTSLKSLLNITYPSQRDQNVLLAVSQSYWDYSDPISFAPFTVRAPLPGPTGAPLPVKRLLMQEAINDSQVPNLGTRIVVRALGLPQLDDPPIEMVYGLDTKAGPLDSAYTQWDVHATPPPPYNTPLDADNGAHGAIRKLPRLIDQLAAFFTPSGQVIQTCGGMCSFPMPQ